MKCPALLEFIKDGNNLIVMGDCSSNSKLVELADKGHCILISRKKGWLKKGNTEIKDFVSEDYVILGKI